MSSVAVPASKIRPEIQGLRAVAVATVLVFHVWPALLPGGYVGVDVFFVISGFLITSMLVREAEANGRIGFGTFYLRRAKRLLPAATAVLAFVSVATPLLLPETQWEDTAWEILASVFYVENWRLAFTAVDYLAAENAPSPVQHYWSLSVEEQFYLFWPALIAVCLLAVRRRTPLRSVLRVAFSLVIAASLGASILCTLSDPGDAYFVSYTRAWELALGGLLAVTGVKLAGRAREFAGFVGLAAILVASLAFSEATAFPGYAALLPTVGAALVILAGSSVSPVNPVAWLSSRPLQFLGDASYSVYLWHWPLVVLFLARTGGDSIGVLPGCLLIGATIVVSMASKRHIEDRFRFSSPGPWLPGLAKAFAIALVPLVGVAFVFDRVAREEASLEAERAGYLGAALIGEARASSVAGFVPSLLVLKRDRAEAYDNGCHLGFGGVEPVACRYGDPHGEFKVFLVGDSHAANWIPALEEVANREGWAARSYTKSACALMPVMLGLNGKPYVECLEWGRRVREIISEEKPNLVIFAQRHSYETYRPEGGEAPSLRGGIVDLWREIEQQGVQVTAIGDTPQWKSDPGDCLARDPDCVVPLRSIRVEDPLLDAHRQERRVGFVDMTDVVCPEDRCSAVVGNVVVWRDRHHLTATYSRSASGLFLRRLSEAIENSKLVAGNVESRLGASALD